MTGEPSPWIDTKELAAAAGITRQQANRVLRSCLAGGKWQGHQLEVRVELGRGGKGGQRYSVRVSSLPPEIAERATAKLPVPVGSGNQVTPRTRGKDKKPRVLIGREWDCGIDLAQPTKSEIAAQLDGVVKSLWASAAGGVGWRTVARNAREWLFGRCREVGSELPDPELRKLCNVPERFVRDWDRRKHNKTHVFKTDAKAFHDALPGIERQRPKWPLEVVIGDGTALDIYVLRPDGSQQLYLHEISVVTMPAAPRAGIVSVKQQNLRLHTKSDLVSLLRDAGLSKAAAARIAAGGWPALMAADETETEIAGLLRDSAARLKGE